MKTTILGAVLVLMLVPAALPAQGGRDSDGDDPVEVLLDIRRELDLSREQVDSLRAIQRRLESANRPFIQRLMAIQRQVRSEFVGVSSDSGGRNRQPTAAQLAAAREPLEKIQENNLAAMEEVNILLTPEQKRRAATLLQLRENRNRPSWMRWPGRD